MQEVHIYHKDTALEENSETPNNASHIVTPRENDNMHNYLPPDRFQRGLQSKTLFFVSSKNYMKLGLKKTQKQMQTVAT